MRRIALLLILLPISLAAQSPTPGDAVQAYEQLNWVAVKAQDTELVCIPRAQEQKLDMIVLWLANRAKSQCT